MNRGELLEALRKVDEVALLELLQLTSDDLIDAFADRVEEYEGRIRRELMGDD
jgi:hypothetical protein